MHEMTLCAAILDQLEEQARAQNFQHVKQLWLEIGALACVDAEALRFGFGLACRGTLAEGAIVHIEQTPGRGWCSLCQAEIPLNSLLDPCPGCASYGLQITPQADDNRHGNDLAVGGATPRYLTCSMIIEEGLRLSQLRRVVASMAETAVAAGVQIVTGDTKVVPRGSADKLFINTTGIGVIPAGISLGAHRARPGDAILVNGPVGDHGAAIVSARGELALDSTI